MPPQQVIVEDLRAMIFYAWNLKPEQIVIDDNTAHYVHKTAKYLSDKFGGADDLPIVYSEDFRKTMARLSVAYGVLDLSTTADFSQVLVNPGHVAEAYELLERIYVAENCRLDQYAKNYLQSHGLADLSAIRDKIDFILSRNQEKAWRFASIVCQLLKSQDGEKLRKTDLADELGVDKQIIQQEMRFFIKIYLVQMTPQGIRQRPGCFDFLPSWNRQARMLVAAGPERPLLLVVFHTMARIDEVLRLKWEDVNFEQKAVRLWTRKRRGGSWEYDWLPMNEDLEKVLWSLWQNRKDGEWVFFNPFTGNRYINRFKLMRSICRRAGVRSSATTPSVTLWPRF